MAEKAVILTEKPRKDTTWELLSENAQFDTETNLEIRSGSTIDFIFRETDQVSTHIIGWGSFTVFPGCRSVVISHGLSIDAKFRGKRPFCSENHYSYIFQMLRKKLAISLGFDKIVATINMENLPQLFSAKKAGWKFIETFKDSRTGNLISLIELNLEN